ncbi:MAG: helix-turn-helix domain-containing protein [Sphingomonadales bacterium]|nr:helix-turn-helix domain-containing protein [Sphingomonadales bacterium]
MFRLYGEPGEPVVPGFVHAERISFRAPLHGWEIRAHRHAHLSQAFLFTGGKGIHRIDDREGGFEAPWLMWIPADSVHGFSFLPGTEGLVVSVADDFLTTAIRHDPEAARLRAVADEAFSGTMGLPEEIDIELRPLFEGLLREACGSYLGSISASAALIKLLLVGVVRTRALSAINGHAAEARASLYRRYRKAVEARLREGWSVARYASELCVSTDRLHDACTEAAGKAPQQILHDRLMLEAKRNLIYTTMSVSEIACDLGFSDPAYFSRFFSGRAGMSPSVYRKVHDRSQQ